MELSTQKKCILTFRLCVWDLAHAMDQWNTPQRYAQASPSQSPRALQAQGTLEVGVMLTGCRKLYLTMVFNYVQYDVGPV